MRPTPYAQNIAPTCSKAGATEQTQVEVTGRRNWISSKTTENPHRRVGSVRRDNVEDAGYDPRPSGQDVAILNVPVISTPNGACFQRSARHHETHGVPD